MARQVFSDPTEQVVVFEPINRWQLGEEFTIRYSVPFDLDGQDSDWIGIYKVRQWNYRLKNIDLSLVYFQNQFSSLEQYVAYEYTSKSKMLGILSGLDRQGKHYSLTVPDTLDVPGDEGEFVLLYFQSTGTRGVSSMVGMSEPFQVIPKAPPSPQLDSLD